jgi:FlaA1/EpsC-like NDP-sugar epimerase
MRQRLIRPLQQLLVDVLAWFVAIPTATLLRFRSNDDIDWDTVRWVIGFVVVVHIVLGFAFGLYRRRLRYGSSDELLRTATLVLSIGLVLSLIIRTDFGSGIRYSVPALAPPIAVMIMVGSRLIWRRSVRRYRQSPKSTPILVVGAGDAGYSAVRLMLGDTRTPYHPVALVDDDPLKANLRLFGIPVLGTIPELGQVIQKSGARAVLLAIPSADIDLVRFVDALMAESDVPLLTLPPVTKLFATLSLADIRPVTDADLLGRPTSEIDTDVLAAFIRGKRVMVTGAGGSIGSELCRQLHRYEPSALIMVDHDESLLADVQLSLEGRALLDDPNLVLADVRDAERMEYIFDRYQPDIVFHAAALKHLTLLERFPREAWMSNVMGTVNVLRAAQRSGVSTFVNISTDKAADPTSVLGSSKRITERLTAHFARETGAQYVSVRFGNVLGTRGSVLTIFERQAELGGPLTVTDPGVTRYFMTVHEATRLTAFAGAIGRPGEVLVLDMGAPVRIADVARRFARQHSPELEVVFTGLRAGEKMHESLFSQTEHDLRPVHPLVSHVPVPPLTPEDLGVDRHELEDPADAAHYLTSVATN